MNRRQGFLITIGLTIFLLIGIGFWFAITSHSFDTIAELAFVYVLFLIVLAILAPRTSKWAKSAGQS